MSDFWYNDRRRQSAHHNKAVRDAHRVVQTGSSKKYKLYSLAMARTGGVCNPVLEIVGGCRIHMLFILQTCRAGKKHEWKTDPHDHLVPAWTCSMFYASSSHTWACMQWLVISHTISSAYVSSASYIVWDMNHPKLEKVQRVACNCFIYITFYTYGCIVWSLST